MKVVPFIADNAAAALAQIHAQLGPDAVVLNVRQLPAPGFKRFLQQGGRVEVLAGIADEPPAPPAKTAANVGPAYTPFEVPADPAEPPAAPARAWHSIAWLESMGLLPQFADRLQNRLQTFHGPTPPIMPIAEWSAVRSILAELWRPARPVEMNDRRPHVFVGPPGSGKTTVLCKWLTYAVLTEERTARVWRLDGLSANTSEFLTIHAEMLGIEAQRFWSPPDRSADLLFVDLPGVEAMDSHGLTQLSAQLATLPAPHVHLVLNAAYETATLFEQIHAFAPLNPEDVIFTHLDEERRRVKLWNFVLGTNCSLRFLSAGQKIPGEFLAADSALLFPHQTPNKHAVVPT
jgi:flagellar biosynthesis protein FlhF